ncbi:MAG: DUF3568 family protein [Opitutaceae bacterium]|nr:DUF3568 family protein [Opitutaceae bacterium]
MKLRKILVRFLAGSLLMASLALHTGCVVVAAGAAGAGAVAYIRGELETTLEGKLDNVHKAANRAVGQLEFAKISDRKDAFSANLVARTAQDKKVDIVLTKTGDNLTKVQIRVGVFGDEELSRALLEKIKAAL